MCMEVFLHLQDVLSLAITLRGLIKATNGLFILKVCIVKSIIKTCFARLLLVKYFVFSKVAKIWLNDVDFLLKVAGTATMMRRALFV